MEDATSSQVCVESLSKFLKVPGATDQFDDVYSNDVSPTEPNSGEFSFHMDVSPLMTSSQLIRQRTKPVLM